MNIPSFKVTLHGSHTQRLYRKKTKASLRASPPVFGIKHNNRQFYDGLFWFCNLYMSSTNLFFISAILQKYLLTSRGLPVGLSLKFLTMQTVQ